MYFIALAGNPFVFVRPDSVSHCSMHFWREKVSPFMQHKSPNGSYLFLQIRAPGPGLLIRQDAL